jgi:hypothetical protein
MAFSAYERKSLRGDAARFAGRFPATFPGVTSRNATPFLNQAIQQVDLEE